MGVVGRLRTGLALSRDGLAVLREHPVLVVFPLAGGLAGVAYVGLVFGGSTMVGLDRGPALFSVLFNLYLGSSVIAAFFTAAVVYAAREVFEGRRPGVREALAAAWRKKHLLFAWAIATAVVGWLLRVVERPRTPAAGAGTVPFGVAWAVVTYFVVPVILFEDVDVGSMFRRSGEAFREAWGGTAGAGFGVGLVTAVVTALGFAVAVLAFLAVGTTAAGTIGGLAIAVIVAFAAYLSGATLAGIAKAALYVYATEGTRPAAFDDVDFARPIR